MTKDEFKEWFRDHRTAFPAAAAFVNKSPDKSGTLRNWYAILEPYVLADALEATRRMLDGREEPIKDFDRALTAQRVASVCKRVSAMRQKAPSPLDMAKQDRERYAAEPKPGWSMEQVRQILAAAKERGEPMTVDEAIAEATT